MVGYREGHQDGLVTLDHTQLMVGNTVGPRPTTDVRRNGCTRPDARQKRATDADKS